jgi:GT2 family glycosyltransferase
MVREEFPQVLLVESKENLGFAKGNNRAIKEAATQPFVWLLNSDTETGNRTLEQLFAYMEAHPEIGALGPQLIYPDNRLQSVGGYFPSILNVFYYLFPFLYFLPQAWRAHFKSIALFPQSIPERGLDLEYVTGAALLLRRTALDQVGLMSEDYFMYFEETDMCWRMKKAGWKIRAIPTDPVVHVYGGSFKSTYDKKRLKLFQESLAIFVKKNFSGMKKNIILLELFCFGNISILLKKFKR